MRIRILMNLAKLESTLVARTTRTYCVLEGASVPDLPAKLYEFDPPHFPLIGGELTPDMVHVVPYVALLVPTESFTTWVLENFFGKNWGIFVHTRYSIYEMRRHFRSLIQVTDEEGRPMLFRFYDPRVIRDFLPTCDEEQIEAFFGNVDSYFSEAAEGDVLIEFGRSGGELTKKEIDLADKE